jgi:hypothetical protein
MSKYEEFQQLFVSDGRTHQDLADDCFDAIDRLTRQMIEYSGWYSDDVEYISLSQPITSGRPKIVYRYKRSGRNLDRIRETAVWVNNLWSLGIRFRLRPDTTVSFSPREAMFVLPILAKSDLEGNITLKIESEGTFYRETDFGSLIELVFQRIQQLLEIGIQHLIGRSHKPDDLLDLGFVLDSESMKEFSAESQKPSTQPLEPTEEEATTPTNLPSVEGSAESDPSRSRHNYSVS